MFKNAPGSNWGIFVFYQGNYFLSRLMELRKRVHLIGRTGF